MEKLNRHMCGIAGYCGAPIESVEMVGLLTLQLERGTDGFGLATVEDKGIKNYRTLDLMQLPVEIESSLMVAHNRLPTHGDITVKNCHPFVANCYGTPVGVVHNGIIYNHGSLRKELEELGHTFTSEVDSEVLVHLAEMWTDNPTMLVKDVFNEATGMITAAFILPTMEQIILVRNRSGSPVYVEEDDFGVYFASSKYGLAKSSYELKSHSARLFEINK